MVSLSSSLLRGGKHPGQRCRLRISRRRHGRVRRDAVPSDRAGCHLAFEEAKSLLQPPVELDTSRLQIAAPSRLGVREEVLGIMQQAGIKGLKLQPGKRPFELLAQELRMDTVPAALHIFDHLWERLP